MLEEKDVITLGIETSCDETSAAIIVNGRKILANIISSQVPVHQKFGGVVPEIASRKHIENVLPVIDECLNTAKIKLEDINHIGVTHGPGLVGALLVGVAAAKALAYSLDIPLIGVNHLEGHIFANFLAHPDLEPPFVALVVSGGHTSLIHVKDYNEFYLFFIHFIIISPLYFPALIGASFPFTVIFILYPFFASIFVPSSIVKLPK